MKELAQELGCTGTIGFYPTDVEYSEIHSYKKYLELRLDCPNLFEKYDTLSLQNIAYRDISPNRKSMNKSINFVYFLNINQIILNIYFRRFIKHYSQ